MLLSPGFNTFCCTSVLIVNLVMGLNIIMVCAMLCTTQRGNYKKDDNDYYYFPAWTPHENRFNDTWTWNKVWWGDTQLTLLVDVHRTQFPFTLLYIPLFHWYIIILLIISAYTSWILSRQMGDILSFQNNILFS